MGTMRGRWAKVMAVAVLGVALLFAGCAGTMMGSDQGIMTEKEGRDKGM